MPDAPAVAAPATPAPATPAAAAPATPVVADPGAWRSSLAPEYASSKSLEKFTTPNDLAKSYLELEKANGTPKLPMPQPTWDDKAWGDFYDKAGRPKDAKGYEFSPLEKLPEGLKASPEMDDWFAQAAHKEGLSKKQGNALRDAFVNYQAQQAEGMSKAAQESAKAQEVGLQKLEAQYGQKWPAALDAAKQVVNKFGNDEFKALATDPKFGNNPAVVAFLAKIGSIVADHEVIRGAAGQSFGQGPASAQAEINRMNTDPNTRAILTDSRHPEHDKLMAKRAELYKIAIPS